MASEGETSVSLTGVSKVNQKVRTLDKANFKNLKGLQVTARVPAPSPSRP